MWLQHRYNGLSKNKNQQGGNGMVPKQAGRLRKRPASWPCVPLLSLTLLLPTLSVAAQGYTEDDLIGSIPVALSVTRLPQSVTDTSMTVSVID